MEFLTPDFWFLPKNQTLRQNRPMTCHSTAFLTLE